MGTRAFGYVRLSKEDRDSTSPARQRERIERLCRERGWELVETFEDIDVSAYNGKKRPAFTRMMGRLGEAEAIVFWRLDRLSRSVLEFSRLLEQTQAAGVQIVSTDQPIDTSSAMGKAFVQVASVFAELEAGTTSERSRQMHAYKRERGEPVGKVPYGWRRNGKGYEPDPQQQAVLREAAKRYVAGETFTAIARALGFSAPTVISRILHSPAVQDALPGPLAGQLAEALHGRRWERVPASRQSLLGGIARCGECGAGMTRSSTRAGRKGRWFSYGCHVAGHAHISGTWLDQYVSEQVVAALDTKKLVAAIRRRQKVSTPRRVSELEARLDALEAAHYVEGTIPASRFKPLRDELVEKLRKAKDAERQSAASDLPIELARDLVGQWDSLPVATRRRVVAAVVERVEVEKAAERRQEIDPARVRLVWRA